MHWLRDRCQHRDGMRNPNTEEIQMDEGAMRVRDEYASTQHAPKRQLANHPVLTCISPPRRSGPGPHTRSCAAGRTHTRSACSRASYVACAPPPRPLQRARARAQVPRHPARSAGAGLSSASRRPGPGCSSRCTARAWGQGKETRDRASARAARVRCPSRSAARGAGVRWARASNLGPVPRRGRHLWGAGARRRRQTALF